MNDVFDSASACRPPPEHLFWTMGIQRIPHRRQFGRQFLGDERTGGRSHLRRYRSHGPFTTRAANHFLTGKRPFASIEFIKLYFSYIHFIFSDWASGWDDTVRADSLAVHRLGQIDGGCVQLSSDHVLARGTTPGIIVSSTSRQIGTSEI